MTSPATMAARSGFAAITAYVAATAAGSALDPGYSQIRQHVSDLTAASAPTWAPLVIPYLAYNGLAMVFAMSLYRASPRTAAWRIGLGLLTANAIAGVGMVTVFREDLGGMPTTTAGAGHLVLAGVSSVSILLAALVFGIAFRRAAGWQPLSVPSLAIATGFAVLGPLAAVATATGSGIAGLAERGPIGLFLVWTAVVATFLMRQSGREIGGKGRPVMARA